MISFDKVKLGEDSGAPEIVGEILDVREGIPVRSGDGVDCTRTRGPLLFIVLFTIFIQIL